MEEIMNILEGIRPDVDFANESALIDDGILDSFDIVSIVGELTDAYEIDISTNDLIPENFNSAEAICNMVQRLKDE